MFWRSYSLTILFRDPLTFSIVFEQNLVLASVHYSTRSKVSGALETIELNPDETEHCASFVLTFLNKQVQSCNLILCNQMYETTFSPSKLCFCNLMFISYHVGYCF